jgi:hypothetical protein
MRVTTFLGLAGLAVVGVIVADFLIHPTGTAALGSATTAVEKPALDALLGSTS